VLLLRCIEIGLDRLPHPMEHHLSDVFLHCWQFWSWAALLYSEVTFTGEAGVDLQYVIGQEYDGAGNVHGNCQGLKSTILQLNSKAVYVWCCGHRFNLRVAMAASVTVSLKNSIIYSLDTSAFLFSLASFKCLQNLQKFCDHSPREYLELKMHRNVSVAMTVYCLNCMTSWFSGKSWKLLQRDVRFER